MSPERKPKVVAMIVASAIIMQQIDSTVITTALPQMAISLHTDPIRLSVAVTAYLLSLAIFVPVSGWAADRFGGRTVFRAAIALFTLGSMLCGLSGNFAELTAARVLQGFGGAMMVPVGRLVLFRSLEKAQLIGTMAYLQVPAQLGPVLGPPIGGFITTYFSWRWIFFVNVPLGILGIVLVTLFFDNPKEDTARPLDWIGFLLTGVSLFCIMYGIEAIGRGHSESSTRSCCWRSASTLGALALRHLRRATHPVLDLSVFRIATFRASICGGSVFRAGAGTLVFLLPLLLQVVFGLSAFDLGQHHLRHRRRLDVDEGDGAADPRALRLPQRHPDQQHHQRRAIVMCAFFTAATPLTLIFVLLLIAGFFMSLQFTATQAIAYADVQQPQMSDGDQHCQHGAAIEPRLRHCARGGAAASVAGLARRERASAMRISSSLSLAPRVGALLRRGRLAPAARCRRRGQRPPAQDFNLRRFRSEKDFTLSEIPGDG